MTKVDYESAFDGAKCVQVRAIGGFEHIQVWYGGTQVRVFTAYSGGDLVEQTVWTMTDDEGKAPSRDEIERAMAEEFARVEAVADDMEGL